MSYQQRAPPHPVRWLASSLVRWLAGARMALRSTGVLALVNSTALPDRGRVNAKGKERGSSLRRIKAGRLTECGFQSAGFLRLESNGEDYQPDFTDSGECSLVVGGGQHPHRNNYIQLRGRNSREMSQEIVRSLSRAAFARAGANLRGR